MTIDVKNVQLGGTQKTGTLTVEAEGAQSWTAKDDVVINYTAPAQLTETANLLPEINNAGAGYQYIIPATTINPTISFEAEIKDNIFDRAKFRIIHTVALNDESMPKFDGNTYIQGYGAPLASFGANKDGEPEVSVFDDSAEKTIKEVLGDKSAKIYTI